MSRYNPHHATAALYQEAERWREECLIGDGSILSAKPGLWNGPHFEELRQNFVESPDETDAGFFTKLEGQLKLGPPESKQLMAELLWLLLLFPSNILPDTKRDNVVKVWDWSREPIDRSQHPLSEDVLGGIGRAGRAYNSARWRELHFIILAFVDFKARGMPARRRIASDPWEFCAWLDSCEGASRRQLRHILPHLLFPDTFERISSTADKRKIIAEFTQETEQRVALLTHVQMDQELLGIRKDLEKDGGSEIDFYGDALKDKWKPGDHAELSTTLKLPTIWIEKTIVIGRTDRLEGPHALGKALWSPQKSKSGGDIYSNMRQVAVGDVVLHLTDNQGFTGTSRVAASADDTFMGLEGTEWEGPCYRIGLKDFEKLTPPLERRAFLETAPFSKQLGDFRPRLPPYQRGQTGAYGRRFDGSHCAR